MTLQSICPNCGAAVEAGNNFCLRCGARASPGPAAAPRRFCPNCGATVPAGAEFCANCGNRLTAFGAVQYAGFWMRLIAYIIDGIILNIVGVGIAVAFADTTASVGLGLAVGFVYNVGFWVFNNGATPGKMAMGIRVVVANGDAITPGRAVLRWVGYIVSAAIFLIGYLMIAFTAKKRGLHDYIAGTVVIRTS